MEYYFVTVYQIVGDCRKEFQLWVDEQYAVMGKKLTVDNHDGIWTVCLINKNAIHEQEFLEIRKRQHYLANKR